MSSTSPQIQSNQVEKSNKLSQLISLASYCHY